MSPPSDHPFDDLPDFDAEDDEAAFDDWGDCLAGRLLISMPGIGDPRFERAVILMCVHSPDQAMGITVNRPVSGLSLRGVMDKLGVRKADEAPDQPVPSGGPVERERGFVLHTDDYETLDATLPIGGGVSLTATREILEAIADSERRPHHATLALGCAQWAPGQLELSLINISEPTRPY